MTVWNPLVSTENSDDVGKLLLRLMTGGLLILHGIHKIITGPGYIESLMSAHGLPQWTAYAVYLGEVVGPALIIAGLYSRLGGLLIFINMIVAVLLARLDGVLSLNQFGGWAIELEVFYAIGGLLVVLLGAGRYSLGGVTGKWN